MLQTDLIATLQKAWTARGWLACVLWPLSKIYGALTRLRRFLYRHGVFKSTSTGRPTIVIGNVVAGGGGKTPLVIALTQHLQRKGLRVGVVSRGYGRDSQDCVEVTRDLPVFKSGDEPALIFIATSAPVFVAKKRVEAASELFRRYPETQVLVCDDGLQHMALERDIEIVVFDDRGVGNGWLLPAGPLREFWPRQRISKGELVLHTGTRPAFKGFTSTRRLADHALTLDGQQVPLSTLAADALFAVAAIATPAAFFDMLMAKGLSLTKAFALPDHHDYRDFNPALPAGAVLLCTEKDAVKLAKHPGLHGIKVLAVPLFFEPEPAFFNALDKQLAPLLSDLPSLHVHKTA